jgi:hypothetical protein
MKNEESKTQYLTLSAYRHFHPHGCFHLKGPPLWGVAGSPATYGIKGVSLFTEIL